MSQASAADGNVVIAAGESIAQAFKKITYSLCFQRFSTVQGQKTRLSAWQEL